MRSTRWTTFGGLTGILLAIALAAPVAAADETVTIDDFAFEPGSVTVQVGDSVTWTNADTTAHTATDSDGSFDTESIGTGQSSTIQFQEAGRYRYVCSIHPTMTGSVVVQAAATAAPSDESTAPPTDTVFGAGSGDGSSDLRAILAVVAVLAAVMLIGTLVAERRFRPR
jgi:plastocyanin